jgi:hypothetical protein
MAFPEPNPSNLVAIGNYDKVISVISMQDDSIVAELKVTNSQDNIKS